MQQQGREIQAEGTESRKVANTFAEQQEVRVAGTEQWGQRRDSRSGRIKRSEQTMQGLGHQDSSILTCIGQVCIFLNMF